MLARHRLGLSCVVKTQGGNSLKQARYGKLFRDATIIDLTVEDGFESNENGPDSFSFLDELDDI